jgi:hypothetical protein
MPGRPVERLWSVLIACAVVCGVCVQPAMVMADPIAVRHAEGVVHGFLALRTMTGETIADGDVIQVARGDRVSTRLVFHFKDGSINDETAVFSQRGNFRMLSDHLIQKGPTFPHPMDLSINGSTGQVTVRTTEDDSKEKIIAQHMDLPPDWSNGIVLTLLKNFPANAKPINLSMVVATPKPRLVKLAVTPEGEEPFSLAGSLRKAMHYVVKIEIGGVAGVVAPIVGKQPPDIHVWILDGEAPAFVKTEGPLYNGGPIWRIELLSPVWPKSADSGSGK